MAPSTMTAEEHVSGLSRRVSGLSVPSRTQDELQGSAISETAYTLAALADQWSNHRCTRTHFARYTHSRHSRRARTSVHERSSPATHRDPIEALPENAPSCAHRLTARDKAAGCQCPRCHSPGHTRDARSVL